MIVAQNIQKTYPTHTNTPALQRVSFQLNEGQILCISGPSGIGKSTLLGIAGGIITPSSGEITVLDNKFHRMTEKERRVVRRQHIGIVFQSFQLVDSLSALDNLLVAGRAMQLSRKYTKDRAFQLLSHFGLQDRIHQYPSRLSGGEQQRLSFARALLGNPRILLADEPTGNLDSQSSTIIQETIKTFSAQPKHAVIVATHDEKLMSIATTSLVLGR